ncbi:hypothetical protein [uncultured Desulfovibrio sp.]|uniref:hypothetical protein n=1 Tax=uncultured Desulfovibrio sp. TaxID=167968 RepID=UPI00261BDC8D|nr:hypothetical protein [uncultured Desulfovibrio sp.]
MADSEFLTFCPDGTVAAGDLLSIDDYANEEQRIRGYQPGLARRALINRALRQSSHMGAVLARFVADALDTDVADDGNVQALADSFAAAVRVYTAAVQKGDQGPAGTITIGKVTSLAPDEPARVTNVGTATAAILDIALPRGERGARGPAGDLGDVTPGYVYFFSQF